MTVSALRECRISTGKSMVANGEQTLTHSLLHSIVEHASDGILVVDLDGNVVFCNPALTRIFQRPEDEFRGALFGFPIAANQVTELDILRADGSLTVAEMRVSEACWAEERVLIAMLRDVTTRKKAETELRQAKEALATLYRCAPLGIIALHSDWRIQLFNPAAENILGWKIDEISGSTLADLSDSLRHEFPLIEASVQSGTAVRGKEIGHVRRDGSRVQMSLSVAPVRDDAGRAAGIMCIVEDISRRMKDNAQLRLSGKIFENTLEAITVTDTRGLIVTVNQAFTTITGYTADEVVGHSPSVLKSGRHDVTFYAEMWHTLVTHGQWRGEIWNRRKSGEIYPEWLNISAIHDENGAVCNYVAIFSDITRVKERESQLLHLAHHDALTGLPNRFLFASHAELALTRAKRNKHKVAIMFIDLDDFKTVNDVHGHRVGDGLLAEIARRLAGCLRASDIPCRFGGDEFNVVVPDLEDEHAATRVARKVLDQLARPFHIEGVELRTAASIGIAIYPRDGTTLGALTHAADVAMFEAKAKGKGIMCFHNQNTGAAP